VALTVPAAGTLRHPPEPSPAATIDLDRSRQSLENLLEAAVVSPWHSSGPDGERQPRAPKTTVGQARAVWFLAQLYYSGYGHTEHLAAAEAGFEFLRESMWDPVFGGFFWEVDSTGRVATRPHKHAYAQAVALSALCRYVQVSDDSTALQLAADTFAHLDKHAHDDEFGGFMEQLRRDWGPGFAEVDGYLGVETGLKLVSTHLELIDALASYYRMTGEPAAWQRLSELASLPVNPVVSGLEGARPLAYYRDWTPVMAPPLDRAGSGLDLASIRVLVTASASVGLPGPPFGPVFGDLFENVLLRAYDETTGCLDDGRAPREQGDGTCPLRLQAEAMVAALIMHAHTGEPQYATIFTRTLGSLVRGLARTAPGDAADEEGRAAGEGGYPDVGGISFHLGTALLNALEILDRLESHTPGEE